MKDVLFFRIVELHKVDWWIHRMDVGLLICLRIAVR